MNRISDFIKFLLNTETTLSLSIVVNLVTDSKDSDVEFIFKLHTVTFCNIS